jgi:mono/diheme cytochrome c family protein
MRVTKYRILIIAAILAVAALWYFWYLPTRNNPISPTAQGVVSVVVPASFSVRERQGQRLYEETCAACHGVNATGTDNGPPLVHIFYEPGHHGDASFILATERGVRQHHWKFGDMPPQENVSRAQTAVIVSYVRALQRANGIPARK